MFSHASICGSTRLNTLGPSLDGGLIEKRLATFVSMPPAVA
jgi:hypothetical protein